MAMVFFFTLAVWSGWELTRPQQIHRWRFWWLFYVTLALAFLAKGPEVYFPLIGLIIGRVLRKNDFYLPVLPTLIGFILSLALMGLWGIPAMLQTHGKYFDIGIGEHVINRSVHVNDSHGLAGTLGYIATTPLYFITFLVSFFPWSTRVPLRLKNWWPTRAQDSVGWYLLLQAGIVFVLFSLVRTKLPHYTMPAFPCVALWLALQISGEPNVFHWFGKRVIGMTIFILIVMLGFFSVAKYHFLTENLWRATKQYVRPETKIGCYGFHESSLVWRFRTVSTNFVALDDEKRAPNFLTNSPPFIFVVPTDDAPKYIQTNDILVNVRGLDIVKFKNWNLTAIIRE
jgi:4-amino-4-deoxy-L-arabinose transferase-like glycosyltransferase